MRRGKKKLSGLNHSFPYLHVQTVIQWELYSTAILYYGECNTVSSTHEYKMYKMVNESLSVEDKFPKFKWLIPLFFATVAYNEIIQCFDLPTFTIYKTYVYSYSRSYKISWVLNHYLVLWVILSKWKLSYHRNTDNGLSFGILYILIGASNSSSMAPTDIFLGVGR